MPNGTPTVPDLDPTNHALALDVLWKTCEIEATLTLLEAKMARLVEGRA